MAKGAAVGSNDLIMIVIAPAGQLDMSGSVGPMLFLVSDILLAAFAFYLWLVVLWDRANP
jgi:hypothetical protein